MNHRIISQGTMALIIAAGLLLCVCAALTTPFVPEASATDYGIYFPSPEAWGLPFIWGEGINTLLILSATLGIFLINKHFRLIKTSEPLAASFLLPLLCANPLTAGRLTSGTVILVVMMAAIISICSAWKSGNATKEAFLCGTIVSAGSMIQYAFIPFLIAIFLSLMAMKAMRFKEFCALILGAAAPYWICIGLGIMNPLEMHCPHLHILFVSGLPGRLFIPVLGCAMLLLCTLALTLTNGLQLYAGNAEIRSYVSVINIFGITAAISAVFDIGNISAYLGLFYLWAALQAALFFTLRNMPRPQILFRIIQGIILLYGAVSILIPVL